MKKIRFCLWLALCMLGSLILLCGCAWLYGGESSSYSPTKPKNTVNITVKVKYEGRADEGCFAVPVGEDYTLRAYDTDEYEFSFWERDGEPIFDEAEHTVTAKQDTTYYAVFAPKADDQVLINIVCDRDWYTDEYYKDIGVLGGGYQKKNEGITLASDGELPVSWFTVRAQWLTSIGDKTRGPNLTIIPEGNMTVIATFESVCEIVLADSPNYTLYFKDGDVLMNQDELLSVGMHVADGYVADHWEIVWYPIPSAEQDGFVVSTREEGVNWGKEWTYDWHIEFLCRRMEISLVVTNENLVEPFEVEVIKEEGYATKIGCSMMIPEYFIQGKEMFDGYYMGISPYDDTYIKDVRVVIEKNEEKTIINAFHGEYMGGFFHIPDAYELAAYEDVTVEIRLVSRETHAIVNLISLDDDIPYTPPPEGGYAPSIITQSFVVKKGVSREFYMNYTNNLAKIYEVGYQFSHIADGEGKVISETIEFAYTTTEDANLYIHYEPKPIADAYFDYHWSEEEDGYEVRLSQLMSIPLYAYRFKHPSELHIPSTYNGHPVVEIPDFGMSYYQVSGNGMRSGYGAHLYGTLYVPSSIKRIGEKAFANEWDVTIILDENCVFDEISPDAFYSEYDSVVAEITRTQLEGLVKALHEKYIGDATNFEVRFEQADHFGGENVVGHYESLADYICVSEGMFGDTARISSMELCILYHEFAHHYQFVAKMGSEVPPYESVLIQPTEEELSAWREPYDSTEGEAYWNHPMEVSARDFAKLWSGYTME